MKDKYSLKKRFSLNKSAKPGRSSDFESIGLFTLKSLDAAAELGLHLTLGMVEFARGEDSPVQGLQRAGSLARFVAESVARVSNESAEISGPPRGLYGPRERPRRYVMDLRNAAGATPDAELFDPAAQSARMQLEKARRAVGAVDLPTCTLEDLDDVGAVDLLEG